MQRPVAKRSELAEFLLRHFGRLALARREIVELEAQRAAEAERERKTVRVNEFITVSELAQILKVPATEIVAFAFKNLGLMVTINLRLDFDQIELIAVGLDSSVAFIRRWIGRKQAPANPHLEPARA